MATHCPPDDAPRKIRSIELRSGSYPLKYGLLIGSTRAEIGKALNVDTPPRGSPYIVSISQVESVGGFRIGFFPKLTVLFDDSDRAERMTWRFGGH